MGLRYVIMSFTESQGNFNTYDRGSIIIDGVFSTCGVEIKCGGYLPFGKGLPIDHGLAWIEISGGSLLGNSMNPMHKFAACHLQCRNPKVRLKFEKNYEGFIEKHNIGQRVQALESVAMELQWSSPHELEGGSRKAEMYRSDKASYVCRKLCIGNVDWSLKGQKLG
jgi:hypothetical protein